MIERHGVIMEVKTISELSLPKRFELKLRQDIEYLVHYPLLSIQKIILFGSCARGECKVTSDLDLLIVTQDSIDRQVRGDIASVLDDPMDGVTTDVVFYQAQIFDQANSLFLKKVKEDGVLLDYEDINS